MSRPAKIFLAVFVFLALASSCLGQFWLLEVPLKLLIGWALFIKDVVPKVRFNWPAIGVFAIAVPVALVLAHRMAIWLWKGLGNETPWRWKWTMSAMAAVMLMFVAGMSATGVAHQTGWLIHSPVSLVESSWNRRGLAERIKCAYNLRAIYQLIKRYSETHAGFRPETLSELLVIADDPEFLREMFVCPAAYQEKAPGTQPSDWRAAMLSDPRKHVSYLVAPVDTLGPDKTRNVLLYDLDETEHRDGMNVLYEDGEVVWLNGADGRLWLQSLARPATTKSH